MEESWGESCSSENLDRTYSSETDMDTVEDAQTVSPNLSFSGQQSEGQRSIQARDYYSLVALYILQSMVALETGPTVVAESPPTEGEEGDAFKLVREIFFTKD